MLASATSTSAAGHVRSSQVPAVYVPSAVWYSEIVSPTAQTTMPAASSAHTRPARQPRTPITQVIVASSTMSPIG